MHTVGLTTRQTAKKVDRTTFGYESPPESSALHRDVYKWIHSLDMSHAVKSVRRDLANGFLVAEVFSRYFPNDIQMHSFENASSSHYKRDNWAQLQRFCKRQNIELPEELIEGTMQGVHGAAAALLEHLYEVFTSKKVPKLSSAPEADATAAQTRGSMNYLVSAPTGNEQGALAGARGIASQLKSGNNLEFGGVQTKVVGDAVALRRRLAGQEA